MGDSKSRVCVATEVSCLASSMRPNESLPAWFPKLFDYCFRTALAEAKEILQEYMRHPEFLKSV